jgi:hypothetical protein
MTSRFSTHEHRRDAGRATLCALTLFLSSASAAPQTAVSGPDTHVGEPAIASMVRQGIMRSPSPAQFDAAGPNARGDFAAAVQRLFDLPVPARHVDYLDVPPNSEFAKPIQAVSRYLGREMRCFGCQLTQRLGPGEPVSRLEAVITVTNILVAQHRVELVRAQATDAVLRSLPTSYEMRGPIRPYLATAIQNDILLSTPSDSLAPDVPFTRADLAALLERVQRRFDIPQRSYAP